MFAQMSSVKESPGTLLALVIPWLFLLCLMTEGRGEAAQAVDLKQFQKL